MSEGINEKRKISVVIPSYNERDSIPVLCEEIARAFQSLPFEYEVIFVDDGSTDGSFGLLREICRENPRVRAIRLRRNSGQGAALKAGFDHASGDLVITMDGDLQNDPADIPEMVRALTPEYDVICGWRAGRRDSPGKKISSRFANTLRKLLIGDRIHDYGCTFRVYRKPCVEDFELYGDLHRYIPALMRINGYRVGEIRVSHRDRKYGKTKYNWKRLFRGMSDLLAIAFWSRFAFRPMHLFGTAGVLAAGLGFLATACLVAMRLIYGTPLLGQPLLVLSLLTVIFGFQLIAMGVFADILLRVYYGQRKGKIYRVEKTVNI